MVHHHFRGHTESNTRIAPPWLRWPDGLLPEQIPADSRSANGAYCSDLITKLARRQNVRCHVDRFVRQRSFSGYLKTRDLALYLRIRGVRAEKSWAVLELGERHSSF
ncbi:hypothetical protein EVAR_99210_1 [Eumeta japonica]|uniref:Uncharacterized protein n=1 Tax=Eumeta variegata TaxID=151549 RepID=A0A4C1YTH5_EUMVA|nr:hypothetical protein EVAR_99210_1 [Eumeta japonica]